MWEGWHLRLGSGLVFANSTDVEISFALEGGKEVTLDRSQILEYPIIHCTLSGRVGIKGQGTLKILSMEVQ